MAPLEIAAALARHAELIEDILATLQAIESNENEIRRANAKRV
jgi:hypothetical protein